MSLKPCLALLLLSSSALLAPVAMAQSCPPGVEFCVPPPCYRAPDDPNCNPDCTCDSPDYPACDPYCAPGDICDPNCGNPCWVEFSDACSDPPPACVPGPVRPFTFIDDQDGNDNGQIFAVGRGSPTQSCGTILVEQTGYYSIFDTELSESCSDQRDETGYLTISNSCNGDGWAVERNAGDRFLVLDSDNSPPCTTDAECGPGKLCREGNSHGRCCVPAEPVFMGTYLLVAGEQNRICINHWCPEWKAEIAAGHDFGFIVADCSSADSIHFRIDATAIACEDETTLQPCSWGCDSGSCNPDPCASADCPAYCKDGVCLDENPCAALNCAHGCVNGRCLQNRFARGPDADMDGYSELADCDDNNFRRSPGLPELCGTGVDENCDGFVDEMPCDSVPGADAGTVGSPDAGVDGGTDVTAGLTASGGGCGCRASGAASVAPDAVWLAFLTILVGRRRRNRS